MFLKGIKMASKTKYSPKSNRPTLPAAITIENLHYRQVAWYAYWKMCKKTAKSKNCSLLEAHRHLQAKHPFEAPNTETECWRSDNFMLLFMWQFEGWQLKTYDLEKIHEDGKENFLDFIKPDTSAEICFTSCGDCARGDFICNLWCRDCWNVVKEMADDPIFGCEAKIELSINERRTEYKINEVFRLSALPENVHKLYEQIKGLGPSNYTVKFPYPKNQNHNVENCLCVMADGGPIFRLEVLDPEACTRFKLAELMSPWWSMNRRFGDTKEPGEGEYDFPFYDFNIVEGNEFDLEKLMEVIKRGCEQISTRSSRKWGI